MSAATDPGASRPPTPSGGADARAVPRVSVVMPMHDAERHVGIAVRSILEQTFADFELLVVDDGSTDGSTAVVEGFDDPRIRIVRQPRNLGVVAALNRGLELARGTYVARMDADDVARPERFARQVARLDADPALAVLGTNVEYVDADGERAGGPRDLPTGTALIGWRLLRGTCLWHPTVMLRRSVLADVRYSADHVHAEDYELWLRLARAGHAVDSLPEVLLQHRRHPGSVSGRHRAAQLDAAGRALAAHVQASLGLDLTVDQAAAVLDPAQWHRSGAAPERSPVAVVLELERRFLENARARGETRAFGELRRAVRRDTAFFAWKVAALALSADGRGAPAGRRVASVSRAAGVLLARPAAAVRALYPERGPPERHSR